MVALVVVRDLRKSVDLPRDCFESLRRHLHGAQAERPAQVFGVKHRAEARQQAILEHAAEACDQFAFGTGEALRHFYERAFTHREVALQFVDEAAVERVHQRRTR